MSETETAPPSGISEHTRAFYAARNAVIDERNAKVEAAKAEAEAECQRKLAELRAQYNAERAAGLAVQ